MSPESPGANEERLLAIGLMSGTSADGIDAAAVDLWTENGRVRVELRAFETTPYPDEVRDALFRCFRDEATASEVCLLNARIGELFADAAVHVLRTLPLDSRPAFVASHGQTVWHQPTPTLSGTLRARGTFQIGEAARIAERLDVPVVSDFRQQDLALGGQGAPLVPYVDYLFFAHERLNRAVQNLGGIGNVAYLPAGRSPDDIVAFDTGPGNALIDAAARLVSGGALACDLDGALAAGARVDDVLLRELLREPYYGAPPPKSTGRELFGERIVQDLWGREVRGPELVSTLTQLTVESVRRAYAEWLGPLDEVIVGGGGARNPELMRRLAAALAPARVISHDDLGVNSEAKEAIAFAVLGYETLRGRPSNVPSATGARRRAIQGKICRP